MKFYEYTTVFDLYRKIFPELRMKDREAVYLHILAGVHNHPNRKLSVTEHNQFYTESRWYENSRPYYNVWPGISKHLIKLRLDAVRTDDVHIPCGTLLFRLSESDRTLDFGPSKVMSVLANDVINNDGDRQIIFYIDVGERDEKGIPIITYQNFIFPAGETINNLIDKYPDDPSLHEGLQIPRETLIDALKLCISCCLISQDKEEGLIVPDVLTADREKFERSGDIKYFEKAKRRGKFGWNVGAKLDVSPHWRRAHAALYWTGTGRNTPKIIFRKGSIVHREVVKSIPTGKFDHDNS